MEKKLFLLFVVLVRSSAARILYSRCTGLCPEGLIAFGDSLSDTGNVQTLFPDGVPGGFPSGFPYGITWPGYNTGRSSDGRLMIDYIAHAYGFEGVEPYFADLKPHHRKTVNFAQSGATARSTPFQNPFYLALQVKQFVQFKHRVLASYGKSTRFCDDERPPPSFFKSFLYFILVGGNDINHNLKPEFGNKTTAEIRDMIIPEAVKAVEEAISVLHDQGGRNFLVFGRPPQGCTPMFKTLYGTSNTGDYDSRGCLIVYNNLTLTLQVELENLVKALRRRYSDSQFLFADLYNSYFEIKDNAEKYGFIDTENACCGAGEPFNFSTTHKCGFPGVPVCSDPSKFISWDGNHFTQHYYEIVSNLLLSGRFLDPPMPNQCFERKRRV